jgi:release factor glutamine methyltransferase
MTIKKLLEKSKKNLQKNKISTYNIDAELLLANLIKKNREFLFTHPNFKLNKKEIKKYFQLIKKRIKHWSVAALIGKKEFYGLEFFVDKNTLIPRPESEIFIDEIANLKIKNNTTFIDLGTGSGCLIISLIKKLKEKQNLNFFNFIAIDISDKTLKTAKKNAKKHQVENEITFYKGNLLKPVINKLDPENNLIILANLPYLTKKQVKSSPSIQKEPKKALVAGSDGLKYYKKLFKQINKRLTNKEITLFLEIDDSQAEKISNSNFEIQTKKDLSGLFRLVIAKKN